MRIRDLISLASVALWTGAGEHVHGLELGLPVLEGKGLIYIRNSKLLSLADITEGNHGHSEAM